MEKIKILGVDPSLRNTGLSIVTYDTELHAQDPKRFVVSNCQVLVNPQKYTGTDAVLNMLDMIHTESKKECYQNVRSVIVESPAVMFNKKMPSSTIAALGHISGGAVALFGIDKSFLIRPSEWNRSRKKEVTHNNAIYLLGSPESWHYEKQVKSDKFMEHILDASAMALWWIERNYLECGDEVS